MSHSPFTTRPSSQSPSLDHTHRPANFLAKLYGALENDENAREAMYWSSDGSQLVVADPKLLETSVLPVHYKHCKFTSFCRQLNIYGFARVYPGRHFEDARGNMLTNASVWAHPTLDRDSSMDELLSIKRRAPPRLFRNRRQINEQSASQRPEQAQWRRRQPFEPAQSTAFLPALDLEMPQASPAFKRTLSRPTDRAMRAHEISASSRSDTRGANPYFMPGSAQWATVPDRTNGRGQVLMTGGASGTQTPMGSSSEGSSVPTPQQIVQAMARSRVANASTPTTPKMSPWRKAMWNTSPNRESQHAQSEQVSNSLMLEQSNQTGPRRASMPGSHLREWNNTNMPLHYVIAPEIRPLQLPSPGPRPLPVPSDVDYWDISAPMDAPHSLPYVVKVPPAGSEPYVTTLQQHPQYTAQDLVNVSGQRITSLRPSYLRSEGRVFHDTEFQCDRC